MGWLVRCHNTGQRQRTQIGVGIDSHDAITTGQARLVKRPAKRNRFHRMNTSIVNWATSSPDALRAAAARQIATDPDPFPTGIRQTELATENGFQGGWRFERLDRPAPQRMVYFHGGGFVTGSPEERASSTAWIAALTGWQVLSCRYRLAPEHPWPAQQDDAVAALRRALQSGPILVGGDSAGVSVALWGLSQLTQDELSSIVGFVGIYGAFGATRCDSAERLGTVANGLAPDALEVMYCRLGPDAPKAAQVKLPPELPSVVIVGDRDPLIDETTQWHAGRQALGAPSSLKILPGYEHSWMRLLGRSAVLRETIAELAPWAEKYQRR
jgi:acetyl esterase/lipase